jgi:hypothetical protein
MYLARCQWLIPIVLVTQEAKKKKKKAAFSLPQGVFVKRGEDDLRVQSTGLADPQDHSPCLNP